MLLEAACHNKGPFPRLMQCDSCKLELEEDSIANNGKDGGDLWVCMDGQVWVPQPQQGKLSKAWGRHVAETGTYLERATWS